MFQEDDFVNFMKNPMGPVTLTSSEKTDREEWGSYEGSENVVHLMDDSFEALISSGESVLVMFYAPCKYVIKHKLSNPNFESLGYSYS